MGKKGGCDFRNWKKLRDNLKTTEEQMDSFVETLAKEIAARLLARVKKRTPVGKKPTLEQLGGEDAIFDTYWSGYSGGTLRREWTIGEVLKVGNRYTITVINLTEYASYVEYGFRIKTGYTECADHLHSELPTRVS